MLPPDRIRVSAAAAVTLGLLAATTYADEPAPLDAATGPQATAVSDHPAQSATVLQRMDLESRGVTTLADIAEAVPDISATVSLSSLDTLSLYMRGEGPTAPGNITLDGAVGIQEDGFYLSRLQANTFDLLDLQSVEVRAGPQGAAFGRNTTGGVINLISQSPTGRLDFDESVDFGNRNSYRVLSSVDLPRWYGFAAKVTGVVSGIDGYVTNQLATEHGFGEDKQRAIRLQLLWDGISNLSARYFIERSVVDSTPEYDSIPAENGVETFPGYVYYADPRGPMTSSYRPLYELLSTSNHIAQGLTPHLAGTAGAHGTVAHGLSHPQRQRATRLRGIFRLRRDDHRLVQTAPVLTGSAFQR